MSQGGCQQRLILQQEAGLPAFSCAHRQCALHTGEVLFCHILSKFPKPALNAWAVEQVLLAAVVQLDGRPAVVELC